MGAHVRLKTYLVQLVAHYNLVEVEGRHSPGAKKNGGSQKFQTPHNSAPLGAGPIC
jgi:hypothetical protein